MKQAINSEVGRRTTQAKYKRLKNRVQQLTTAVSTPTTTKQKSIMAQATITKSPSTLSTRTVTTAGKATTKTAKAATTITPSLSQVAMKTEPAIPNSPKASKATTSYTGLMTRARAKKQAQVHLLETIPENLLSESEDEEYYLLEDLQSALAEDDSDFEEVETELPDLDVEIDEK